LGNPCPRGSPRGNVGRVGLWHDGRDVRREKCGIKDALLKKMGYELARQGLIA